MPSASKEHVSFSNPFLQLYSEYVEYTEPSFLYHTWAAIGGVAASLGRRVSLQFGIDYLFPNQFIVLVGPPGARKGTSLAWMARRLMASTNVRFAPDDTSGQRQGLISAFIDDNDTLADTQQNLSANQQFKKEIKDIFSSGKSKTSDIINLVNNTELGNTIHPKDKNVLFARATEFDSLIGKNAGELLTFLCRMFDNESYSYQLKREKRQLTDASLTILGATTPNNIAESLPPGSIGQGFTSRLILVYSEGRRQRIARPVPPCDKLKAAIETEFRRINQLEFVCGESPKAMKVIDELYHSDERLIADSRFTYYYERRHTHLLKLCMCLAAARGARAIDLEDVYEAQAILTATERHMPDALGEFGISPLAAAKQKLLDILRAHNRASSAMHLYQIMRADVRGISDFHQILNELVQAQKIVKVKSPFGGADCFVYKDERIDTMDEFGEQLPETLERPNVVQLKVHKGEEDAIEA